MNNKFEGEEAGPFLRKKGILNKIFGGSKKVPIEEIMKSKTILLYIDKDKREAKFIKNIKSGNYSNAGFMEKKKNVNHIITSKAIEANYEGYKFPLVIQYEREFWPYPHEPLLDAERTTSLIDNLRLAYENYDKQVKGFGNFGPKEIIMFVGAIIGIFLGAIWLGEIFGVWETIGWFQNVTPVAADIVGEQINEGTIVSGR